MANRSSELRDRGAGDESSEPPEKRYYRIGEVSKLTGVKPYVLRYWESEFRWMSPQKSRSKQRLYRKRDIDMILLIKKLLYGQRYTIAGARKKLRDMGVGQALETGDLTFETDHRARYRKIREELANIRAML
jgi:DNA-binding transcriptional MerR regulator